MLNFLLSALNEKYINNDGKEQPVELRMVIAASNEYPEHEGLEAIYDRFIFRHWVNYIQDANNRVAMAKSARNSKKAKTGQLTTITLDEIDMLQEFVYQVDFPDRLARDYDKMVRALNNQQIFISDRRYNKGQVVMMANALLNGRTTVSGDDFMSLKYVLWNKDVKELDIIEAELGKYANPHENKIKEWLKKAEEVRDKTLGIENRTERAGEAVQAIASFQDIIAKMNDEIDEARAEGLDTTKLEKMVDEADEMMNHIKQECLRQTSRAKKRDW